ncbi:DUF1090 domain-containing protein [Aliivibrio sp. SR45-2]|uniref:DUF1090 domain-containing protein n=1 Tax=Aliivibrio sp. SR45-2 TaxID=2760931 RepID=UPI0015F87127|nr:DUF1090 domain-containing protein [Aliivibrio sp. SR45-2]MBB1315007.1 DUF1090 domain-containing protein [Aliivibrio sp. SR45-2]
MKKKTSRLFFISAMSCSGLLFGLSTAQAAATLDCSTQVGCAQKSCEIEKQISIAEENGNDHKVVGLNIALTEVTTYCTNDDIKGDLREEIEELNEEIAENHSDLIEAKQDQKEDKIKKYQQKIAEKEQKIDDLKKELLRIK